MKFRDKVVLITGSSRGIGKATALLFAKEGAKIVVNHSKSSSEAQEVVDEVIRLGSDAIAIQCDVSNEGDVKKMIERTVEKYGKIDILVNNAGIVYDIPLFEKTVEQWQKTNDVNLIGVFLCSKYTSEIMKQQASGIIINISSINGIDGLSPESADYDASKSGVISLTKNMAEDLGPHIRVNAIAPGWVETEMNKELETNYIEEEKKKTILRRFAQPEEIGNVALFLASDAASFMTGSVIIVDGGYR